MTLSVDIRVSGAEGDRMKPVYVIKFADLLGDAIATYYSTGPVNGLDTTEILADVITLPAVTTTPIEGRTSIGATKVTLLDLDKQVQDLLSDHNFKGRDCSIYLIYEGVPWAAVSSTPRYTGEVTNVTQGGAGTTYTFHLKDRREAINKTVLTAASMAAEPWVGARTWTTVAGPTLALSDADANNVYDTATIQGNAIEIALCLMLGGSTYSGDYSGFPLWACAGLTDDHVDIAKWETARDLHWPMATFKFVLTDGERLKNFIEKEIMKILGGFMTVSGDGKIGCRFFQPPIETASLTSLSDDDIIAGTLKWDGNYAEAITHVEFEFDFDGDSFDTKFPPFASPEYLDGTVKNVRKLSLQSRGLHTSLGAVSIIRVVANVFFRRYGHPPPKVSAGVFFKHNRIEAGDIVILKSVLYPNVESTQVGENTDRFFEVQKAQVKRDRVQLQLLDLNASLEGGASLAIIAPAATPDFSSATDAQKKYAFAADNTDDKMGDGTSAGYVWA